MITFILDIIIMLSLGTALYLLARTLPRVDDREMGKPNLNPPLILVYLERTDELFRAASEKFLRRSRVWVLKIDNSLSSRLNKVKKENGKNSGFAFGLEEDKEEQNDND